MIFNFYKCIKSLMIQLIDQKMEKIDNKLLKEKLNETMF